MANENIQHKGLPAQEGIMIGLIGAAIVAGCYLIADLARGTPLLTPSVLGEVILFHQSAPSATPNLLAVSFYTVFHVAIFCGFGMLLGVIAGWARTNPIARYGILQVFVVFVLFAWGALSFLSEATLGLFPVPLVIAANLLSAMGMTWWIYAHHPSLRAAIKNYPLGASDVPAFQQRR